MNVWAFCLSLSVVIWSAIFDRSLLTIYFVIFMVYLAFHIFYQQRAQNSFRRKVQLATWNDAGDPSVRGQIEIDLEPLDKLIEKHNRLNPSNLLTYTAIFVKALGEGLAYSGQIAGKIAFGKYVSNKSVDFTVAVDINGENLTAVVIRGTNFKNIREINTALKADVRTAKSGNQEFMNNLIETGKFVPSFVSQLVHRVGIWFCYDVGVRFPILGLEPDNFGCGLLTNIMSFGLYDIFPPLAPNMKTVFTAAMNAASLRPVVVDGALVIRKMMNLNITLDHRFADGSEASKVVRVIKEVLANPEQYL